MFKEYEDVVHKITILFAHKYFKDDYTYDDSDWIGRVVGDVICINDYWFSIDTMIQYLKYRYTPKQMFEHYDYDLDMREKKKSPVCIRDWKKLKKGV